MRLLIIVVSILWSFNPSLAQPTTGQSSQKPAAKKGSSTN